MGSTGRQRRKFTAEYQREAAHCAPPRSRSCLDVAAGGTAREPPFWLVLIVLPSLSSGLAVSCLLAYVTAHSEVTLALGRRCLSLLSPA